MAAIPANQPLDHLNGPAAAPMNVATKTIDGFFISSPMTLPAKLDYTSNLPPDFILDIASLRIELNINEPALQQLHDLDDAISKTELKIIKTAASSTAKTLCARNNMESQINEHAANILNDIFPTSINLKVVANFKLDPDAALEITLDTKRRLFAKLIQLKVAKYTELNEKVPTFYLEMLRQIRLFHHSQLVSPAAIKILNPNGLLAPDRINTIPGTLASSHFEINQRTIAFFNEVNKVLAEFAIRRDRQRIQDEAKQAKKDAFAATKAKKQAEQSETLFTKSGALTIEAKLNTLANAIYTSPKNASGRRQTTKTKRRTQPTAAAKSIKQTVPTRKGKEKTTNATQQPKAKTVKKSTTTNTRPNQPQKPQQKKKPQTTTDKGNVKQRQPKN
jgi:hypothetical protein